jgi:hypothetical protein
VKTSKLLFTVNDRFKVKVDNYCYHLVETYEGLERKTRKTKQQEIVSFYPSLEQCLRAVKEAEIKECQGIDEVLNALTRSYKIAQETAEGMPKPEGRTL